MLACGVALVPCGFALGSIDLVRIGTLLGGVVLVAAAFAARRTLDLTVERVVRPARVQVDEPTTVTLVVAAPRGGASPAVRAEETLGYALGDRPRFVVPGLRGDASCRLTYGVRPTARGRHRLGPLAVAQADPLGLTQRRALVGGEAELVALPRLVRLDGLPAAGAMAVSEGAARHRSAAHGHDDVTVREYREGDELRRVHWPATARTGEVMVRQEDLPSRRSATVVLDPRPDRHLGSGAVGTFEWAVSAAASVATHLAGRGFDVDLVVDDPADGPGTPETIVDRLTLLQPHGARLPELVRRASGPRSDTGLVVLVGGLVDADDIRALQPLATAGRRAVALLPDPAAWRVDDAESASGGEALSALARAGWVVARTGPATAVAAAWADATEAGELA